MISSLVKDKTDSSTTAKKLLGGIKINVPNNGVIKTISPASVPPKKTVAVVAPSATIKTSSSVVNKPLPTTTPIYSNVNPSGNIAKSPLIIPSSKTPISASSQPAINNVIKTAQTASPKDIQTGISLLNSGQGVLTDQQKQLQANSTSPSLLPKTKALKDAEYIATLPQESAPELSATVMGSKWMVYVGASLALLVLILVLKNR